MTTITSSPSLSPKSFAAVPPHHSAPRSHHHQYSHHSSYRGTASPRSPSSPFARPRPSPTLAPRSPAVQNTLAGSLDATLLGTPAGNGANGVTSPLSGPALAAAANTPAAPQVAGASASSPFTNRNVQPSPASIASAATRSALLGSPLATTAAAVSPALTAGSPVSPKSTVPRSNGTATTTSHTTPTADSQIYSAATPNPHTQYRDFGTQYTPRGLPPTASRKRASQSSTLSSLSTSSFISNTLISTNVATARGSKRKDSSGGGGGGPGASGDAMSLNTSSSGDVFMSEATTSGAESASGSVSAATPSDLAGRASTSLAARVQPGAAERKWNGAATASGSGPSGVDSKDPHHQRSDSVTSSVSSSASSLVNSLPSPPKRSRPDMVNARVLPNNYMDCDVRELGIIISDMLLELIRLNDRLPPRDGFLTRFHSRAPPTISVRDYLSRLIIHATLSPPLLLAMVYYIDRLCALYPAFTITSLTVHRFLITASTVAAKGLSDSFWTNHTYARVGGVSTKELAMLELDFLARLDWGIVPKAEVLVDYYKSLVGRADGYVLAEEPAAESSNAGAGAGG